MEEEYELLDLITALQVCLAVTAKQAGVAEAVVADIDRIIADTRASGEGDIFCVALEKLAKNIAGLDIPD